MRDPSPPSSTIDATAWVVAAPAGRWDDLYQALAAIPADARRDLAGRVVAAARDGQTAVLTARLTSFGDQALLPLPPEFARPLVEAAGLALVEGPAASMSQIIDDLVRLSWQTARDRARPNDWPAVDRDPALTLRTLESEAETACARLHEPDAQAARTAFAVLLNQVGRELSSPQAITLAGAVLDAHDPAARPEDAAELWTALAHLGLSGLASPSQP